jgi:hypothetical protein
MLQLNLWIPDPVWKQKTGKTTLYGPAEAAKNMEEILSVQSEINGIQEEIESAAGRIEYLGHHLHSVQLT